VTRRIVLDLPACGMRALFYWGVCVELGQQGIVIDRIYGRSSGAILGACFFCLSPDRFQDIYHRVQHYQKTRYIVDRWCRVLEDLLPPNAFTLCTHRLFVTSTRLGCIPSTISVFRDNTHLLETLRASGSIPFITTRLRVDCRFDGAFLDCFYPYVRCGTPSQWDLPVLRVTAPCSSWPDRWIPVSTNHSSEIAQASVDLGRKMVRRLLSHQQCGSCFHWR